MNKPFFLTRQTANLMEEFARELQAQAGLYLIHGDQGVGKTRLLVELAGSRLAGHRVHWMDLKAGSSVDGALVDSSVLIEKTFAGASTGDVIVADHFENAMKKTRHQLFLSWSTDGREKNLNLIISANSDYFDEINQLALQYDATVQSFQHMPFSPGETLAFLGFYLFPDRLVGDLVIPPLLRNQLALAQGNVAKIIEIAERAGDQIRCAPTGDSESIRQGSNRIVGVLVAVAVLLGMGWYYLGEKHSDPAPPPGAVAPSPAASDSASSQSGSDSLPMATAPGETAEAVAATAVADLAGVAAVDSTALQETDSVANEADNVLPQAVLATNPEVDAESDSELVIEARSGEADASLTEAYPPTQGDGQPGDMSTDTGDSDTDTLAVENAAETVSAGVDPIEQHVRVSPRLRQDLQTSLDWITALEEKTGTLQIMSVSRERFDEQAYYGHLDELTSEGVDVSRIRIIETYTGNKPVLSVVYGEYPSRSAAYEAQPDLPTVLRKLEPISRSVGGLRVEMQRLSEQN